MSKIKKVYLISSLRNPEVPKVANRLRRAGFEVFDDWFAAGPTADDAWQSYEKSRGSNFQEALDGWAANHVFNFDYEHLNTADIVVLMLPAGKSGHLELGWSIGRGKLGFIIYGDEPERYDVMYKFADGVFPSVDDFLEEYGRRYGFD